MASSPAASTGAAMPSGQVKVHVVKVSNEQGSLTFEPSNLQAAAGSMVQFHFYPKEGMVGVINPPAANQSRTIESFTALAKKATANLSPGQSLSSASSSDGDNDSDSSSSGSSSSTSSGSGSASSSAAAPAASTAAAGSGSSSSVTMPLSGTNSSSTTDGAASPSGSAGGQAPQSFKPGSGANVLASGLGMYGSLGLAGVVGVVVAGVI
ncbi:MAG: hypothetical protein LQ338_005738 [Usnochroma carphineum]|nr:MAG: hypothetical protein LQ338_005738 [Usnochroma carphineum]